jgi:hypothetical protein
MDEHEILKAPVHAVLASAGVQVPMSDLFGPGGQHLLVAPALAVESRSRVESLLRVITALDFEIDSGVPTRRVPADRWQLLSRSYEHQTLSSCSTRATFGRRDGRRPRPSALPWRPSLEDARSTRGRVSMPA